MASIPHPKVIGLDLDGWRPGQEKAIAEILDAFRFLSTVVLSAPPGAGKSIIAVAVALMLTARTLILTRTKSLQAQYVRAGPSLLRVATGRDNHQCPQVPGARASVGPCVFGYRCPKRHGGCGYYDERDDASGADIAVVNYALARFDPDGGLTDERGFIVADECHDLESDAAQLFSLNMDVTLARFPQLGLPPLPANPTVQAYRAWAEDAHSLLAAEAARQQARVEQRKGRVPVKGLSYVLRLVRLAEEVSKLRTLDDDWVVKGIERSGRVNGQALSFVPLEVGPLIREDFWRPESKLLLMSGSIGEVDALVDALGAGEYRLVEMASTIPSKQRPITYWPQEDVIDRHWRTHVHFLAKAVSSLIDQQGRKGLVHTANKELAEGLAMELTRFPLNCDLVFTHATESRSRVFQEFRAAPAGAVLVSPSVDYGEDFPDDQARWQAIVKVPYPPLRDSWVKAKMQRDQPWYDRQTVQGLVQAAGRIVRGPDDWGSTFILDRQFEKVYRRSHHMFPAWFHEGIEAGGGMKATG